ncbi:MAG: serine/threonine protein kinase [Candidatus Obscuribacterales bacterium]|nr:serine/threonine protein kinase [Candidatus Obscuribacterales bacterium]
MLTIGTTIDQRYELLELIGYGGMGEVFKARELRFERLAAVKVLQSSYLSSQHSLSRFSQEGKILSRLSHPNIIKVYRYGIWQKRCPYIAMEYIQGGSLSDLIASRGALPAQFVIRVGIEICQALQYAHDAGVTHRDLKPSNILLAEGIVPNQQVAKIIDFGLAKLAGTDNTASGSLIGSAHYMSPEQCLGKKADARSDIYSVGFILYEALAGAHPLAEQSHVALLRMQVHDTPEPVGKSRPDLSIPADLETILIKALAKKPGDRYQSMADFAEDLAFVRDGAVPDCALDGTRSRVQAGRGTASRDRKVRIVIALALLSAMTIFITVKSKSPDVWTKGDSAPCAQRDVPKVMRKIYLAGSPEASRMAPAVRCRYYGEWLKRYEPQADHVSRGTAYLAMAECPEQNKNTFFRQRAASEFSAALSHLSDIDQVEYAAKYGVASLAPLGDLAGIETIQRQRAKIWSTHEDRGLAQKRALAEMDFVVVLVKRGKAADAAAFAEKAVAAFDATDDRDAGPASVVQLYAALAFGSTQQKERASRALNGALDAVKSFDPQRQEHWYEDAARQLEDCKQYGLVLALCQQWYQFLDGTTSGESDERVRLLKAKVDLLRGKMHLFLGQSSKARVYLDAALQTAPKQKDPNESLIAEAKVYALENDAWSGRTQDIALRLKDCVSAIAKVSNEGEKLFLLSTLLSPRNRPWFQASLAPEIQRLLLESLRSISIECLLSNKEELCPVLASLSGRSGQEKVADFLLDLAESKYAAANPKEIVFLNLQAASLLALTGRSSSMTKATALIKRSTSELEGLQPTPKERAESYTGASLTLRILGDFTGAATILEGLLQQMEVENAAAQERLPSLLNLAYVYACDKKFDQCRSTVRRAQALLKLPGIDDFDVPILYLIEVSAICKKQNQPELAAQILVPLSQFQSALSPPTRSKLLSLLK